MGRAYNKKNGKKGLKPTERQKKQIKGTQNKEVFVDNLGHTDFTFWQDWLDKGEELERTLGKKRCKEILDKGFAGDIHGANDEFLALNSLRLYRDEMKGIIRDEMNDPKFKFNIENRIQSSHNAEIEFGSYYDKYGRFWGNFSGDKDTIIARLPASVMVGGFSLHNHPNGGGILSGADFMCHKSQGYKTTMVTGVKGTYVLTSTKGTPKYSQQDANRYEAEYHAMMHNMSIFQRSNLQLSARDWDKIAWRKSNAILTKFAKAHGFDYKFYPRKEYEDFVKED